MNFDFSEDVKDMREHARRFLRERLPSGAVRKFLETNQPFDKALWAEIADMGWLGVTIPEEFGGTGFGYEAACMLAEEIGAVVAPAPLSSTVFAAEALICFGSVAQKHSVLPEVATGARIGCIAIAEGAGEPHPDQVRAIVKRGKLSGVKVPAADGVAADFAIVAARENNEPNLYLVNLKAAGVARAEIKTIDAVRPHASLTFVDTPAERLETGTGWSAIEHVLDRAAVLTAFEQVGGAQAALDMAVAYAKQRYAFGRPIGSLQAIKHKLADMYVAVELARSNAYFGAWALDRNAPELPVAAAAARVAAIDAFHLAAKENIQTHGGMGFTWESDCHLYYRRAKSLALSLGGARHWKQRLIERLDASNVAGAR